VFEDQGMKEFWEMAERYTRLVTIYDSLKFYRAPLG